jgi:hypothetical protein
VRNSAAATPGARTKNKRGFFFLYVELTSLAAE